jgi:hypothetical protein
VIKEVKIGFGSDYLWGFIEDVWTAEFNLYGDPEYGGPDRTPAGISSEGGQNIISETTSVSYHIPDYLVTTRLDGKDWVEIPGGYWLQAPGFPIVPSVVEIEEIAPGYQVQDVRLVEKTGMSVEGKLYLPLYESAVMGKRRNEIQAPGNPDFWPGYDFNWQVNEHQDGSSTLMIQIYPLWYRPQAGEAVYYHDFTFEIITKPAGVLLSSLATDKPAYLPGEPVTLSVMLFNGFISPVDAVLAVDIRQMGGSAPVDGLPLRLLSSISGPVSVEQTWDSTGFPSGDYFLMVELRGLDGSLIDAKQVQFKIGVFSGEMGNFSASREEVLPGDQVSIEFDFTNTGSESLSGQAVVEIVGATPEPVAVLTEDFTGLGAQGSRHFEFVWQIPLDAIGSFRIIAYVQYDSQTTPAVEVYLHTPRLYLPVTLR